MHHLHEIVRVGTPNPFVAVDMDLTDSYVDDIALFLFLPGSFANSIRDMSLVFGQLGSHTYPVLQKLLLFQDPGFIQPVSELDCVRAAPRFCDVFYICPQAEVGPEKMHHRSS